MSREVLLALLFGLGWLISTWIFLRQGYFPSLAAWVMGFLGLALIYGMAQVYHLRAAPAWNTWRTEAGFLLSALLLGVLSMAAVLAFELDLTGIQVPAARWNLIGMGSLALLSARSLITRACRLRTSLPGDCGAS